MLCLSPVIGLCIARLLTREGLPWLPGDCEEIALGRGLAARRRAAAAVASRRSSYRLSSHYIAAAPLAAPPTGPSSHYIATAPRACSL